MRVRITYKQNEGKEYVTTLKLIMNVNINRQNPCIMKYEHNRMVDIIFR